VPVVAGLVVCVVELEPGVAAAGMDNMLIKLVEVNRPALMKPTPFRKAALFSGFAAKAIGTKSCAGQPVEPVAHALLLQHPMN